MTKNWDVVIVGGGAAGLSAALTLGRSLRKVLVLDSGQPRNRFAAHMHSMPGHENVAPGEYLAQVRHELRTYDVTIQNTAVNTVTETDTGLKIHTADNTTLLARALIIASGVTDVLAPIDGLQENWGRTVLHCPYCHGWEVRHKPLAIIAVNPLQAHQAQLLRQWTNNLTVFSAGLGDLSSELVARLQARDVTVIPTPVARVESAEDSSITVHTTTGQHFEFAAVFTMGQLKANDDFVSELKLTRADTPMGSFLQVDTTGKTSHDRIWAVGNVVNASANVAISVGSGALTAGAVNMALVEEDFTEAVQSHVWHELAPEDYWEKRYQQREQMWSGRVNASVAAVATSLTPGRSLDLGCGEGADVLWFATHGWDATGIDISATAIARARQAAAELELGDKQPRFIAANLATMNFDEEFDLVTATFLHSPVELDRTEILRQAASHVAPGGHLLITSHAAAPPWADQSAHNHVFLKAHQEVTALDLPADTWQVIRAEQLNRDATAPDGTPAQLEDSVVLLRRLPADR